MISKTEIAWLWFAFDALNCYQLSQSDVCIFYEFTKMRISPHLRIKTITL